MPGMDGKGPEGKGPGTGRRQGRCKKNTDGGNMPGQGRGTGNRRRGEGDQGKGRRSGGESGQ